MRSDAKIGLICAFAIVLGVVIYFVIQGNNHPQRAQAQPTPATAASPAPSASASPAPSSVTPGPVLAQAGVGGPFISAPTSAPAAGSPTPPSMTPPAGLDGGTRVSDSASTRPLTPPIIPSRSSDTIQLPGGLDSTPTPPAPPTHSGLGGTGLSMTPPVTGTATTHKIVQGDMLGTIAKKYGVTVKAIEEANKGIDPTRLKVGTPINIPAPTATVATSRPAHSGATATTRPTGTAATHPAGGTAVASGPAKPGTPYVVKKGDTLSTIARAAYGEKGSWKKIADANKTAIPNPNAVTIGTEIQIPQ